MPEGTPHVQGTDDPAPPPRHDLVDDQLLEEIELLVDVITRVAGHAGYLSRDEVDSVLGLSGVAHGHGGCGHCSSGTPSHGSRTALHAGAPASCAATSTFP